MKLIASSSGCSSVTVSYTHLDGVLSSVPCRSRAVGVIGIVDLDGDGGFPVLGNRRYGAVSYTHLDVYKRQPFLWSALAALCLPPVLSCLFPI